jgi:hypothetical protein
MIGASILELLRRVVADAGAAHRANAASLTVAEVAELRNIFALLLMGAFVGLPAPPTFLAVELLPLMEEELKALERRAGSACDMLAEMCGLLGID